MEHEQHNWQRDMRRNTARVRKLTVTRRSETALVTRRFRTWQRRQPRLPQPTVKMVRQHAGEEDDDECADAIVDECKDMIVVTLGPLPATDLPLRNTPLPMSMDWTAHDAVLAARGETRKTRATPSQRAESNGTARGGMYSPRCARGFAFPSRDGVSAYGQPGALPVWMIEVYLLPRSRVYLPPRSSCVSVHDILLYGERRLAFQSRRRNSSGSKQVLSPWVHV